MGRGTQVRGGSGRVGWVVPPVWWKQAPGAHENAHAALTNGGAHPGYAVHLYLCPHTRMRNGRIFRCLYTLCLSLSVFGSAGCAPGERVPVAKVCTLTD